MRFGKIIFLLLFFVLIVSTFAPLLNEGATAKTPDVWVVVHTNYSMDVVRPMLNDLGNVQGLVLIFEIEDNTTQAISKVTDTMAEWFMAFPDYKIDVQITYLFADRYGYLLPEEKGGNWVLNNNACYSDSFMTEYFGALANLFRQYRNVVLFTGYNEPYNHFTNKYLAQEVIKKEYTTFKSVCAWVPFSVEFSMAVDFWESFLGFPENVTVENDIVPYWRDYSDYVGFNLWVDRVSPLSGYESESQARFDSVLALASEWSVKLDKPIHINEFPCWYKDRVKTIVQDYMVAPNICAFYQLCFPAAGAVNDGGEYGLYNLNLTDNIFVRNSLCYGVYNSVFSDLSGLRLVPVY
jgi:hypothetical protein